MDQDYLVKCPKCGHEHILEEKNILKVSNKEGSPGDR